MKNYEYLPQFQTLLIENKRAPVRTKLIWRLNDFFKNIFYPVLNKKEEEILSLKEEIKILTSYEEQWKNHCAFCTKLGTTPEHLKEIIESPMVLIAAKGGIMEYQVIDRIIQLYPDNLDWKLEKNKEKHNYDFVMIYLPTGERFTFECKSMSKGSLKIVEEQIRFNVMCCRSRSRQEICDENGVIIRTGGNRYNVTDRNFFVTNAWDSVLETINGDINNYPELIRRLYTKYNVNTIENLKIEMEKDIYFVPSHKLSIDGKLVIGSQYLFLDNPSWYKIDQLMDVLNSRVKVNMNNIELPHPTIESK